MQLADKGKAELAHTIKKKRKEKQYQDMYELARKIQLEDHGKADVAHKTQIADKGET